MMLRTFIFVFQAEDGIRDHCVTGVQTCALPISCPSAGRCRCCGGASSGRSSGGIGGDTRSEERRVGKEGRSRGSPGDEKKKRKYRLEVDKSINRSSMVCERMSRVTYDALVVSAS